MSAKIARWLVLGLLAVAANPSHAAVKVSEQTISLPTYLAGEPEPNPMFYLGKGSQGAQGRVYPYPLYDTLINIKSNKLYRIVYLENEYVRIGVLPEIGGRLFEAVDKSNGYNFIYRQHVIKPALIGLIGAWISGGVEWNIPHHHRATTFLPVQYRVQENADGSKTIWVGELEIRHRMRWAVGYTLHPGKSYLECSVRILNRTPLANTMLCFANVAVHVNDQYQVIYPPATRFVTFHGKREFTTWPIATTKYAGADFTRGVDVSWYANHIAANSMFAWNYEDDFFAGYDHGKEAGILSFADHHVIPGKKFWTWGNGPRGRMWDKILTDDDGPYIELMVGAYSDNQPDYSWLQPFETKSFEMYWYPFRDIGGVKKANLEAAVNLEVTNHTAKVGFCTTKPYPSATVRLKAGERVLLEQKVQIDPAKPFVKSVSLAAEVEETDLRASLSVEGKELLAYAPVRLEKAAMPEPVKGPPPPKEIQTVEELYLAGQRLEQFHDPNRQPEPYWEEALQRDPGDARVNTALGIRQLKQGRFAEAEQHFRKALERLTTNYTSPKDGEPFYYLGVALKAQGQPEAAFDAFFKATWSEAWRAPGYFALAETATARGDLPAALDYVERSLLGNGLSVRALNLKAALLRHTGKPNEALAVLSLAAQKTDPLDVRLLTERYLAGRSGAAKELMATLREHPATGLETAAEYANAGLYGDGSKLLELMVTCPNSEGRISPLAYYYLADFAEHLGQSAKASEYRTRAQQQSPEYVFPFQWEAAPVLRRALAANPQDARAAYYLGNLLFDGQPEEAVRCWEKSAALDPSFAIVHRNLAVAYHNRKPTPDLSKAIAELELAVAGPTKYAEHFAELDELYAEAGTSPEKRLALLEQNHQVVSKRDDALSREIGLRVFAGEYEQAVQFMTGRKFSVWEGGSLAVTEHWVNAHLLRGRQALANRYFKAAAADFAAAKAIPDNLPTEQDLGRDAEIAYWQGVANEGLGQKEIARQAWEQAAKTAKPGSDGVSERAVQVYYGALACQKLGQSAGAETALHGLVETAERALAGENQGETRSRRRRHSSPAGLAHYVKGLGYLGLGDRAAAKGEFELALQAAPDEVGPKAELASLR